MSVSYKVLREVDTRVFDRIRGLAQKQARVQVCDLVLDQVQK